MGIRGAGYFILGAFVCLSLTACATSPTLSPPRPIPPAGLSTQRPYQVDGVWYYPLPSAQGYQAEGLASWYGPHFNGKPTSDGEIYNMYAMTAAHKTLPLGTHVKVTDVENGRSVIVRINDRGPFVAGRIIDLSYKAAHELGMTRAGVAPVRIEAVQLAAQRHVGHKLYWKAEPVPSFRYGHFTIQVGAFKEPANAYRLRQHMALYYKHIQVLPFDCNGSRLYRVQIGSYRDLVLARQVLAQLRERGFDDAFVVSLEDQVNG